MRQGPPQQIYPLLVFGRNLAARCRSRKSQPIIAPSTKFSPIINAISRLVSPTGATITNPAISGPNAHQDAWEGAGFGAIVSIYPNKRSNSRQMYATCANPSGV
jgi:hypothetical protein